MATEAVGMRQSHFAGQLVDFDFRSPSLGHPGLAAKVVLATVDTVVMLASSLVVMLVVARLGGWGPGDWRRHLALLVLSVPVWPTVFVQHKLYTTRFVARLIDEVRRGAHAIFIGIVALVVIASLFDLAISRLFRRAAGGRQPGAGGRALRGPADLCPSSLPGGIDQARAPGRHER